MCIPEEPILSPSLVHSGEGVGPAFELKFLVEEARASEVQAWASSQLRPDPYGDPARGGAYHTTTLYLDTPALDVFHRTPSFKRSKHRLRRYGAETRIYLERKKKTGDRVRKQRSAIADEEIALLGTPSSPTTWPGHWFHCRLVDRGLRPTALVAYERTAYFGDGDDGTFRLTLDRHLRGSRFGDWTVPEQQGGKGLFEGQVIVEFKFRNALPYLLKELVRSLQLHPGAASKYRSCIRSWQGHTPDERSA